MYTAGANNGRIAQQVDNIAGETVNYTYDALNRLAHAETAGPQWGKPGDSVSNNLLRSAIKVYTDRLGAERTTLGIGTAWSRHSCLPYGDEDSATEKPGDRRETWGQETWGQTGLDPILETKKPGTRCHSV